MSCLSLRFKTKKVSINSECCRKTINIKIDVENINQMAEEEDLKHYLLKELHLQLKKKKNSIKIPMNKKQSQIFYI